MKFNTWAINEALKTTWKCNSNEKISLIEKLFYSFGSVNILSDKKTDVALYSIFCLTVKN